MSTNSLFNAQIGDFRSSINEYQKKRHFFFQNRVPNCEKVETKESASLNLVNNLESARRLSGIKTNTQARKRVTVYFSYDLVQPVVKNGRD
jgi:hypothetical protein